MCGVAFGLPMSPSAAAGWETAPGEAPIPPGKASGPGLSGMEATRDNLLLQIPQYPA